MHNHGLKLFITYESAYNCILFDILNLAHHNAFQTTYDTNHFGLANHYTCSYNITCHVTIYNTKPPAVVFQIVTAVTLLMLTSSVTAINIA